MSSESRVISGYNTLDSGIGGMHDIYDMGMTKMFENSIQRESFGNNIMEVVATKVNLDSLECTGGKILMNLPSEEVGVGAMSKHDGDIKFTSLTSPKNNFIQIGDVDSIGFRMTQQEMCSISEAKIDMVEMAKEKLYRREALLQQKDILAEMQLKASMNNRGVKAGALTHDVNLGSLATPLLQSNSNIDDLYHMISYVAEQNANMNAPRKFVTLDTPFMRLAHKNEYLSNCDWSCGDGGKKFGDDFEIAKTTAYCYAEGLTDASNKILPILFGDKDATIYVDEWRLFMPPMIDGKYVTSKYWENDYEFVVKHYKAQYTVNPNGVGVAYAEVPPLTQGV